jgi:heme exporter protein D
MPRFRFRFVSLLRNRCAGAPQGRKIQVAWICGGLLTLLTYGLVSGLIDPYHEYPFESDAPCLVDHTVGFLHLFLHRNTDLLPPLANYPPFFDGAFILYALATGLIGGVVRLTGIGGDWSSASSFVIWTVRHVNAALLALSTIPVFAALRLIGKGVCIPVALTLIFALSPALTDMDLLRVDQMLVFLFTTLVCLSLFAFEKKRSVLFYLWLGAVTGALASTKLTSPAFGLLPAIALIGASGMNKCGRREWYAFLAACATAGLLLNVRFLAAGSRLPALLQGKIATHRLWELYFPLRPYSFYNWESFLPYGRIFIGLTALSLAVIVVSSLKGRRTAAMLVAGYAIVFSVLLAPMIKYTRGRYILLPFYLLIIAGGTHVAARMVRSRRRMAGHGRIVRAAFFMLLLPVIISFSRSYSDKRSMAVARNASVATTRIAPRNWFHRHVEPGARVALIRWAESYGPPIWDMGYRAVEHLFDPPTLHPERMARYYPPSFADIESQADILVFSDFKRWQWQKALDLFAPTNLQARWATFFLTLDECYPTLRFRAPMANYSVSEVEIHIINPDVIGEPTVAFADQPSEGKSYYPPTRRESLPRRRFAWLGHHNDTDFPLLQHEVLGRLQLGDSPSDDGLWLFAESQGTWFWTSKDLFPVMLRTRDNTWIRYYPNLREPPLFYNLTTGRHEEGRHTETRGSDL